MRGSSAPRIARNPLRIKEICGELFLQPECDDEILVVLR
jgi:hypothetical protein